MNANPGDGRSLDAALRHHKTHGCSVLVAGDVPDPILDRQVADLLGHEPRTRLRVLGLFGREVAVARRRLRNAAPGAEAATVVKTARQSRSTAAASTHGPTDLELRWADAGVESFEAELLAAIEDAAAPRAPLDPAVLRVCVDSLCPVVREHGLDRATEFVSAVGEAVRARRGMVHFVCQGVSADDRPDRLAEAFDVLLDLRVTERGTEQRWRIPGFDVDTGWHAFV